LEWGLVERVVPAAGLDGAVEDWLGHLGSAGPLALRAQKALMREWENLPTDRAVAAGIEAFARSWSGDEPARMMRGFLHRPRPGAGSGGGTG
jgi:enoyl-CoA hydratase/carnithine racemase